MPDFDKRIVVQHTKGRLSGLWRIMGAQSELEGRPLPPYTDNVDFITHKGSCSLISIRTRYVLYRENLFNAAQDFHPSQA